MPRMAGVSGSSHEATDGQEGDDGASALVDAFPEPHPSPTPVFVNGHNADWFVRNCASPNYQHHQALGSGVSRLKAPAGVQLQPPLSVIPHAGHL